MTETLLFAVTGADLNGADLEGPGLPPGLTIVRESGLAAVVGPAPEGGFHQQERSALLPLLLARQKLIGRLLDSATILPVALGTSVEDIGRIRHLLAAGAPVIRTALGTVDGCVEYGLSVRAETVAKTDEDEEQAEEDALGATATLLFETIAAQAADSARARAAERRDRARRVLIERLAPICRDLIVTEPGDPSVIAELALLVPRRAAEALDDALESVDQSFAGQLALRLVGPLPPYSFATVHVHLGTMAAAEAARRLLGVPAGADPAALRQAYRHAIRRVHPDLVPEGAEPIEAADGTAADVAALTAAHRVLQAEHVPVSIRRQPTQAAG
ncbi:GvpL/GvpF family gas vesicle protein [Prosthecomicrobium pneumaticum]|uniref:DnaJ-domain-containing protein 1 n=1 Tax=Prosthecomicrobium pneumaticum TaxID=81895 RepID=A0A7W9CTK4_9HYPH|nr:GvpL/GvpF family gas vesicle protein [Prosthecomicrobium pneumaticum]MBB5751384.1 DnaJ-domain-containing protein 1 [Prosthecomicrobium pneumaticum]